MADAPLRSMEQHRAEFAWQRVALHMKAGEYKAVAKGAPALVMSNGLMQSLLYLQDKGGASKDLSGDVLEWLVKQGLVSSAAFSEQVGKLAGLEAEKYMRATQEAMEILRWIKQFASALLK